MPTPEQIIEAFIVQDGVMAYTDDNSGETIVSARQEDLIKLVDDNLKTF